MSSQPMTLDWVILIVLALFLGIKIGKTLYAPKPMNYSYSCRKCTFKIKSDDAKMVDVIGRGHNETCNAKD